MAYYLLPTFLRTTIQTLVHARWPKSRKLQPQPAWRLEDANRRMQYPVARRMRNTKIETIQKHSFSDKMTVLMPFCR